MTTDTTPPTTPRPGRLGIWLHIFAGLCASLVSIGLARFAYTPLIPALIQAGWFSASDVVYLGAANLAGYLVGALLGRPIASRLSNVHTLRLMMVLVTVAFLACAFPLSFAWIFGWRLMSGVAGGTIMVLVAATVLPHVPGSSKGLASGAIFLGLGLGIAGSGTLVPLLLHLGLQATWIGLGAVAALLTGASWFAWPPAAVPDSIAAHQKASASKHTHFGLAVTLLYVEYALMAVGLVPAMVFLVDFIARGLGAGAELGSFYWILYGVGAILGPPSYGFLADRLGGRTAMRWLLLLQTAAVACIFKATDHNLIAVSTVIIGTFAPGIVPLVLARVHEVVPNDSGRQNIVWGRVTIVSAAAMALSGYAYSAIFNASGGNHRWLFLIGGVAIGLALMIDLAAPSPSGRRITQPRAG